jgi:hypothetical protein
LATEAPPPAQARVRGTARRLVKMILGTDGRCNDPALAATGCPACGAVGRFAPHSSYRRHLEDLEGGELVCEAYGICPRSLTGRACPTSARPRTCSAMHMP